MQPSKRLNGASVKLLERLFRSRKAAERPDLFFPSDEEHETAEKLRQAEAKYRTLVEQLPLVTYIDALTATATSLYASPQVETLLGYSVQEWLEDPEFFPKLLHPADRERVLGRVDHCNRTGERFRDEYRLIARDGRTVWVQDESLVVCDELGRPLFTQGFLLDITDRKEWEQRLAAEHGVVRVLAEAVTLAEAIPRILETVCEAVGWDSGALWAFDRRHDVLRSLGSWPSTADGSNAFGEQMVLARGEGLPGQVWARLEPIWRSERGESCAVPMLLGAQFLGVLELGTPEHRKRDPQLVTALTVIGSQVAQFMERKESEEAVRESEARKRAILDSALDCVITVDHEGRIVEFNPAAERTFGRRLEEVHGKRMAELLVPARLREAHARTFERYLASADGSSLASRIETEALRPDGSEFPIELTVVRVDLPGPPVLTAYVRDITERRRTEAARKRAEKKLWHQALHDTLTGLPNRKLFHDRVRQAVEASTRNAEPLAVLLLDLDRFKEVNDTIGHHSGDRLLRELARRLRSCLRTADSVARLGGDEFGFLLSGVSGPDALELVERIQRTFVEPFELQELPLQMDASIGIALFPDHATTVDLLLQRADVAMYVAKRTGSGYAFYDASRDDHTVSRLAVVGELRRALERRELVAYYQPQVDLRSGRVYGVEALLRWQHPTRGLISPDEFVPIAEHAGLMAALTRYVLDEALRQSQEWRGSGSELRMAVNISIRNLLDSAFPADVEALLERWGIPPAQLALEITESTVVADPFRAKAVLERLSELGLRVAIDDFGTGYSSLAYLRRLPLDEIKIDRSFINAMSTDREDAVIVRSTIDLARSLGLEVVAEGVETEETYETLVRLGCDSAQGYHLSPPLPPEDLITWLQRRREPVERNLAISSESSSAAPS